MSSIVRKDSIEELIGHRDRALALYQQGYRAMVDAVTAHQRACVGNKHVTGLHWEALRFIHFGDSARSEQEFANRQRAAVDADMWRAFLVNTGLGAMMDKAERDAFEKGLEKPPVITIETVFATLDRLRGDAPAIFRRGLVDAFKGLSYKPRQQ